MMIDDEEEHCQSMSGPSLNACGTAFIFEAFSAQTILELVDDYGWRIQPINTSVQ